MTIDSKTSIDVVEAVKQGPGMFYMEPKDLDTS